MQHFILRASEVRYVKCEFFFKGQAHYNVCIAMQILESVCKFQKNFLYAQLLTPPRDYRLLQMYE